MKEERIHKIYARIRKHRIEKKLSQHKVATKLKISQNAYYKIENGKTRLLVSTLLSLSDIFGVKLCDFIKDVK